jgi:hypothetical protein
LPSGMSEVHTVPFRPPHARIALHCDILRVIRGPCDLRNNKLLEIAQKRRGGRARRREREEEGKGGRGEGRKRGREGKGEVGRGRER